MRLESSHNGLALSTIVPNIDSAQWPCPRASEAASGCIKRLWSDADKRRQPQQKNRSFEETHDTFGCRFYQRLTQSSPCEGSQGDFLFDPFAWLSPHGRDLYRDETFALNETTYPQVAFVEGEHLDLGTSMRATVDAWALAGLIDGGAMIGVTKGDKLPLPVDTWEIHLPDYRNPTAPYSNYVLERAHWHYILPDPLFEDPATSTRWTSSSLRAAIKNGKAAVLSFGQLVFVGGDWVDSFTDLLTPFLFKSPGNLMQAVKQRSPLAIALLDIVQNEDGQLAKLRSLNEVAESGKYTPPFEPRPPPRRV